jgi:glutamate--cysteine ligase catalytic subunit
MGHVKRFLYNTASGERPTLAQWMRNYVDQHPDYTHNSILGKKVMDDLLLTLHKISTGEIYDKTFEKIFPDWQPCEVQPKLCSMKIPIEVHE